MTSAHGTPCSWSSVRRRRAPGRHGICSCTPGDDAGVQPFHDLGQLELDAASVAQHRRRVDQVEADDRPGVVLAPAARRTPPRARARTPSSTARCRRACRPCPRGRPPEAPRRAPQSSCYSCTSSISVPKLPFGWMKATVVPRLPGRGAASIGRAPAAVIASSASAQSSTR